MSTSPLTDRSVSISEFRRNPRAAVEAGEGAAVAVIGDGKPVFYCVPTETYESMLRQLDDLELIATVIDRQNDPEFPITPDHL